MPYIAERPIPAGYTEHWDFTIWNVGIVFEWSDVFKAWVELGRCTVKPGQVLHEAFADWTDGPMKLDHSIFFIKE